MEGPEQEEVLWGTRVLAESAGLYVCFTASPRLPHRGHDLIPTGNTPGHTRKLEGCDTEASSLNYPSGQEHRTFL